MKKFLSVLLAALMLMLPVFSMAETAAETLPALSNGGFAAKYTAAGQRLVTDVSFKLGDGLMGLIPADAQAPVQDLLAAMKIEAVGQSSDSMSQGALRILMNGENAADITVAAGENGLYAASSFLGDKVLQFTPDQIKQLLKMAADQMVAEGTLTQEQLDALVNGLQALKEDPLGTLMGLIGNPDPSGLMAAVGQLMNQEPTVEEVTELPTNVNFMAKNVITMTVGKDALKNVTTELGKFLWSMPGVQKLADFTKVNGEAMTEESLINSLNSLPDALAEDVIVRIYVSENGVTPMQIIADLKIQNGENTIPMTCSIYTESAEGQQKISVSVSAAEDEKNRAEMTYDVVIEGDEAKGGVNIVADFVLTQDGTDSAPMHEEIAATWDRQETVETQKADILARIQPDGAEAPVTIQYQIVREDKDLGDHAEGLMTANVAMEGMGDLFALTAESKTDLAEAYIITDSAVQPLGLSAEEQQTLLNEISQSAMMGLVKLMTALPESVQPIVQDLLSNM